MSDETKQLDDGGPAMLLLQTGEIASVSERDIDSVIRSAWRLGSNGYVYKSGARKRGAVCLLHRKITAARPGEEVHHLDGDKLNNCRSNLKVTTPSKHQSYHKQETIQRNKARRIHPATGVCAECGKVFVKDPDHRGRQTVCSKKCSINRLVRIRRERCK